MPIDYRVPNSYVEETTISHVGTTNATAATLFVGASAAGDTIPTQVESWTDFVTQFGAPTGLDAVNNPVGVGTVQSYLGHAIYSYFQNGGRPAIVVRATGTGSGTTATANLFSDTAGTTTKTITNVARTNSTATLTAAAHGYVVGDVVTVSDMTATNAPLNVAGARITAATATTFSYETPTSGTIASGSPTTSSTPVATKHTVALTASALSNSTATNFNNATQAGLVIEALPLGTTSEGSNTPLFTLNIYKDGVAAESYPRLTMTGADGTRTPLTALRTSSLVSVSTVGTAAPAAALFPLGAFTGGQDPDLPTATDLRSSTIAAVGTIQEPLIVVVAGYVPTFSDGDRSNFVGATLASTDFPGRSDIFVVNDNVRSRLLGESSASYANFISDTNTLGAASGDSYVAPYGPWITVADPRSNNARVTIPPGGAVAGTISRTDADIGVFRTPAGVIANIVNAIDVDTVFSYAQLGDLNTKNVNIIRPVADHGICIMGGRTRKQYGVDRYVAARRTLIYVKESLRRSTQFAVFENNDQRLWANLIVTAESILRPLWEAGGLKGTSSQEAYFIICDATLNTPTSIEAGEVHMNIGVALETPAEFIIIRVAQSSGVQTTLEIAA